MNKESQDKRDRTTESGDSPGVPKIESGSTAAKSESTESQETLNTKLSEFTFEMPPYYEVMVHKLEHVWPCLRPLYEMFMYQFRISLEETTAYITAEVSSMVRHAELLESVRQQIQETEDAVKRLSGKENNANG